jgi:(p)ppGpp synthase/HD superfamily hydrolase
VTVGDLERRAREFATEAHGGIGQRRKYTGAPYVEHPAAVAEVVRRFAGHDEGMLAAAWLHDVVEDTPRTIDDVRLACGEDVARLVGELTDVSRPADGNRARRKALDRVHLAGTSPRAKSVKLADLFDNARDIVAHDADFARVYLAEMRHLLPYLLGGDPQLWALAASACVRYPVDARP